MRNFIAFQIIKVIRLLELYTLRRKLTRSKRVIIAYLVELTRLLGTKRKQETAMLRLLNLIDADLEFITEEIQLFKQAKTFDQLRELDRARSTRKVDEFMVTTAKTLGLDVDVDRKAMKVLEYWESRH